MGECRAAGVCQRGSGETAIEAETETATMEPEPEASEPKTSIQTETPAPGDGLQIEEAPEAEPWAEPEPAFESDGDAMQLADPEAEPAEPADPLLRAVQVSLCLSVSLSLSVFLFVRL